MFANRKTVSRTYAADGFTLVELLVALGLVSLLMLLFAEVFTIATGTMSTQRGVMENDQRARTFETVLRNDLKNLAMKSVMPFLPNEADYTAAPADAYYRFSNREGFVSISENEPANDSDDVIHCMVQLPITVEPFYGRALPLRDLATFPNQPDADDGVVSSITLWSGTTPYQAGVYVAPTSTLEPILNQTVFLCITAGTSGMTEPTWPSSIGTTVTDGSVTWVATTYSNQTSTSNKAEVVYFVRNGNLYRRVLLIRNPLEITFDVQPFDSSTNNFFNYAAVTPNYPAGGDFWRDFDFSARFDSGNGAKFTDAATTGVFPIASPLNRFGHNPDTTHFNGSGLTGTVGNPREFVGSMFIGRFTQEETSHSDFNFPHSPSAYGTLGIPTDPVDTDTTVLHDTNANGTIDEFENDSRSRRGEDILLSNVHSFDLKVWDEVIGDYVDLGHGLSNAGVDGDFHQNRNLRPSYGPSQTSPNRMFDTWHPGFNANNDPPGVSVIPDSDDTPPYIPQYGYPAALAGHQWFASSTYRLGSVVVPTAPNGFAYQATSVIVSGVPSSTGNSGVAEPTWPIAAVGDTVVDGDITWTAIPNIKRLKSIKITIRYLDVTSDQMRQVTLIQSLLE